MSTFFFLFETDRETERQRGGKPMCKVAESRGKERENLKQAPWLGQSPTRGSIPHPWDRDLSQNQESDTQMTEPCPSAPSFSKIQFKIC